MSTLSASLGAAVECEGFLQKRGEFGLQLYRRRFFMLRDEELFYMADDSLAAKLNPIGKINVRDVVDVQSQLHAASLFGAAQAHLYLKTPRRIFDLMSEDRGLVARFLDAIRLVQANIARRAADALLDAAANANTADSSASSSSLWRLGVEPDAAALLPPPPQLLSPSPTSSESVPLRRSSSSHSQHHHSGYEAVPPEVLKVFQFTEGFGLDQFLALLEPPVKDALAYAAQCGYAPAHATLFAAALVVRALGSDVLQFNDAVPRTAPLAVNVAREYAAVHDAVLAFLRERAPLLERDTALLDRWIVATRQPVLFGPAAATQLPLAARDRVGLQRWHLLALCRFASVHLEPLRHIDNDSALCSTLYAWDLMVDRLLGELTRLPMTAVGTHLWHVLTESDLYQRDAATNADAAAAASDRPASPASPSDADNPYEAQLRRARERVGSLVHDAIAQRLPRCDDATQDAIQRLLHADVLMQQLVNECETLGLFDALPRLLKLFNDANVELVRVVDGLAPLKPYRALLREQRTKLIAAWWQSASACGGSSLLLERVADAAPAPAQSRGRDAAAKWQDVLVRCTALLKRIASLVDSRQFGAARDVVLLCAVKVQELLVEAPHFHLGPITFH